jgi:hypothetical protein
LRDANKLQGVAVFREYQFDWAERIALDALFDARRMGAEVRNYTRLKTNVGVFLFVLSKKTELEMINHIMKLPRSQLIWFSILPEHGSMK